MNLQVQLSKIMSGKVDIENQVKTLQRQFGGVVKLVKDLKDTVETLERKIRQNRNK